MWNEIKDSPIPNNQPERRLLLTVDVDLYAERAQKPPTVDTVELYNTVQTDPRLPQV